MFLSNYVDREGRFFAFILSYHSHSPTQFLGANRYPNRNQDLGTGVEEGLFLDTQTSGFRAMGGHPLDDMWAGQRWAFVGCFKGVTYGLIGEVGGFALVEIRMFAYLGWLPDWLCVGFAGVSASSVLLLAGYLATGWGKVRRWKRLYAAVEKGFF